MTEEKFLKCYFSDDFIVFEQTLIAMVLTLGTHQLMILTAESNEAMWMKCCSSIRHSDAVEDWTVDLCIQILTP